MRRQNVIIFSSGKNKCVAHEIARGLDGDVCRAVLRKEEKKIMSDGMKRLRNRSRGIGGFGINRS